jgi:hypothetical protein
MRLRCERVGTANGPELYDLTWSGKQNFSMQISCLVCPYGRHDSKFQ